MAEKLEMTGNPEGPGSKEWLDGRLVQLPISMAPPLRFVNSYLLREPKSGGVTIIDPGPRSDITKQEWKRIRERFGIGPQQVKQIIVTHHHPDHFGMAGWLQQQFGAPVLMSEEAHREALRMWQPDRSMNRALPELFRQHGFPEPLVRQLPEHLESFYQQVEPMPEVTYIDESRQLEMGGWLWQPVLTGGHATGHLSFYQAEERMMLCGDAVLPQISPNISFYPGGDEQPLQTFMDGLRKLGQFEVNTAFPGHRHPFDSFHSRVQQLLDHHEERLAKVAGLLKQEGTQTGFKICEALFGMRPGIHQMRFAMSETLAHLALLVHRNEAEMELGERGLYQFSSRKAARIY
ncbi:MBL fold metallo-hydrolase [Paenibacillus physcomitrellae]|uniref:MBL fold metallo-hydrolase n=1 Tax=Paenibacillus physcomitrellae TaxID=1619311 RepID=A0ABQ1G4T0_9BACL|nr:MBL fold metallo-hydrolase [Paenibacillus physcomitrellae]GGA36112.1 MBL fold metallo-hydrolase [Paenibacillus physcomitrellae]